MDLGKEGPPTLTSAQMSELKNMFRLDRKNTSMIGNGWLQDIANYCLYLREALTNAHKVFAAESDQTKKILERDEKRRAALEKINLKSRDMPIAHNSKSGVCKDCEACALDKAHAELDALTPNQKDR